MWRLPEIFLCAPFGRYWMAERLVAQGPVFCCSSRAPCESTCVHISCDPGLALWSITSPKPDSRVQDQSLGSKTVIPALLCSPRPDAFTLLKGMRVVIGRNLQEKKYTRIHDLIRFRLRTIHARGACIISIAGKRREFKAKEETKRIVGNALKSLREAL